VPLGYGSSSSTDLLSVSLPTFILPFDHD